MQTGHQSGAVVRVPKLPPTFTSLFRLFLRATSACVLHHSTSTRNLRRIWRPTFNVAAKVVHRLQSVKPASEEREKLENWLKCWDTRMDATLTLLYSSSQSRGLPHELTQNLSLFLGHHLKWTQRQYYTTLATWKPQLDPSSPEYLPKPIVAQTQKIRNKEEKKKRQEGFDRNAWGALGEVVRMAEGRHQISLGRVTFNERKA